MEEEEEEEKFRWWEAEAQGDGTQKWTTLEHGGVLFPPAYEPLPKNVKLYYDGLSKLSLHFDIKQPQLNAHLWTGKPVDLPIESEEVAGFFGAMVETDHAKDETFCKNFFKDFVSVLAKHPVCSHSSFRPSSPSPSPVSSTATRQDKDHRLCEVRFHQNVRILRSRACPQERLDCC